jgi:hypothetical protein
VNWDTTEKDREFYIGYSYDDSRYLEGEICECRVWNRVLTEEEINVPFHFYDVEPDSEGLVAYWKFDEGTGKVVKDYANGYNISGTGDPTWKAVWLPAKE